MSFPYTRPRRGIGGVYRVNLSNHHFYLGSTYCIQTRWAAHLRCLKKGIHKNPHMQSVFNKYRVFEPALLETQRDENERIAREQHYLDMHFSDNGCVNAQRLAEVPPMLGRKHSSESREKMSKAKRGIPLTEAHKRACSEAQKERHARDGVTEATRQKLSKALMGKRRPDNASRNKAATGWNHTDEAREKIRVAGRRPCSEETKQKIRATLKEKGIRPPLTDEIIQKRSLSIKATWARKKAKG